MNLKHTLKVFLITLGVWVWTSGVQAAPSAIHSSTIDGWRGDCSGSRFKLTGAIGQPDADAPMSGVVFAIRGGFWALRFDGGTRPGLAIRHGSGNTVILTNHQLTLTMKISSPFCESVRVSLQDGSIS